MHTEMHTHSIKLFNTNAFIQFYTGFDSPQLHQNKVRTNTYFFSGGFAVKCSL